MWSELHGSTYTWIVFNSKYLQCYLICICWIHGCGTTDMGVGGGRYRSLCYVRSFKRVKGWCPPANAHTVQGPTSLLLLVYVSLNSIKWRNRFQAREGKFRRGVFFCFWGAALHSMWDLSSQPRMKPAPPRPSIQWKGSLTHWTPREVPDVFKTRLWSVEGGLVSALAAARQVIKRGGDNCLSWRNCCHGEKRGSLRGDPQGKQEADPNEQVQVTSSRREATIWGSLCQGGGGAWRAVRPVAAPGQLAGQERDETG